MSRDFKIGAEIRTGIFIASLIDIIIFGKTIALNHNPCGNYNPVLVQLLLKLRLYFRINIRIIYMPKSVRIHSDASLIDTSTK